MKEALTEYLMLFCCVLSIAIGAHIPQGYEVVVRLVNHPHSDNPLEQSFLLLGITSFILGASAGQKIFLPRRYSFVNLITIGLSLGYVMSLCLMYIKEASTIPFIAIGIWMFCFAFSAFGHLVRTKESK